MSGVGVADRTQILVVATDEGRTDAHSTGKLQNGPVDLMAQTDHGLCLIEIFASEKLGPATAEGTLSRNQDLASVFSAASEVEQAEQHARRTHAQEFVEVSRYAHVIVHSRELGAAQHRHVGVSRIDAQSRSRPIGEAHRIYRWCLRRSSEFSFSRHQPGLSIGTSHQSSLSEARLCGPRLPVPIFMRRASGSER